MLGLQVGKRPKSSRDGYWLYAEDKAIVHLTESETHFFNEKQGYFDHAAFQATNLRKLIQILENKGLKFSTSYNPETEMTQVFFKAPSNTGIEVFFENEKS